MLWWCLPSFKFSLFSISDGETTFGGYNRIGLGSIVLKSTIGRGSYIANARVTNSDIGSFSCIGPGARVGGLGRHPTNWFSSHPAFYSVNRQAGFTFSEKTLFEESARVNIGSDVWIGANAVVIDGISVGDGAIIAAGAVVIRDVEPYEIVGGVPARRLKFRFENSIVIKLREIRWWDWEIERLRAAVDLFQRPASISIEDLINLNDKKTHQT